MSWVIPGVRKDVHNGEQEGGRMCTTGSRKEENVHIGEQEGRRMCTTWSREVEDCAQR